MGGMGGMAGLGDMMKNLGGLMGGGGPGGPGGAGGGGMPGESAFDLLQDVERERGKGGRRAKGGRARERRDETSETLTVSLRFWYAFWRHGFDDEDDAEHGWSGRRSSWWGWNAW